MMIETFFTIWGLALPVLLIVMAVVTVGERLTKTKKKLYEWQRVEDSTIDGLEKKVDAVFLGWKMRMVEMGQL